MAYDARDYKPVRRGPIYCAPFCGAKCTWAAFQKATRDAAALCKRLGKGWKPRVWENLGWHYSAIDVTGYWKVYASVDHNHKIGKVIGYISFFGIKESSGGRWSAHGKTPEAAIRNMQEKVLEEVHELSRLEALLEGVEFGRSRSKSR